MPPDTVVKVVAPGLGEPPGASWTNCLRIGDEISVSGITARGSDGKAEGGDSMEAQTRAVFAKLASLLAAAGGGLQNVYKLVIYVTDMSRKDEVNAVRKAVFRGIYPCSTLVEVSAFAFPGLLVEIDAFANARIDLFAAGA
ncbi:MAG: RidA family protein [Beijerinckiaceae bacterium]